MPDIGRTAPNHAASHCVSHRPASIGGSSCKRMPTDSNAESTLYYRRSRRRCPLREDAVKEYGLRTREGGLSQSVHVLNRSQAAEGMLHEPELNDVPHPGQLATNWCYF